MERRVMATSFTRSHGANARAQSWDEIEDQQGSGGTGSWLPLDALDEEGYIASPQLRAMPTKAQAAQPQREVFRPTTAHPARVAQPRQAPKAQPQAQAQTRQLPGVQARTLAMMAGAVLCALAVYVAVSSVLEWAQVKMDDLQYGRPRTAQVDAY